MESEACGVPRGASAPEIGTQQGTRTSAVGAKVSKVWCNLAAIAEELRALQSHSLPSTSAGDQLQLSHVSGRAMRHKPCAFWLRHSAVTPNTMRP